MRFNEDGYCVDCNSCACRCDCEYENTTEFRQLSAEDRENIFKKICQEREEARILMIRLKEGAKAREDAWMIKKNKDREQIAIAVEMMNRIKLCIIDLEE